MKAAFGKTSMAGFYTAKLTTRTNKTENRVFAVNVDPAEGDLKALSGADLNARLAPELKYKFDYASSFETRPDEAQGRNLGDFLLYVLLAVLFVEQLLAWSCGYHVSASTNAGARSTGFSRNRRESPPAGRAAFVMPPEGGTTSVAKGGPA